MEFCTRSDSDNSDEAESLVSGADSVAEDMFVLGQDIVLDAQVIFFLSNMHVP